MTKILLPLLVLLVISLFIQSQALFGLLILGAVIYIYAINNPLKHERAYRLRSFWNWFPMGLTYAFLYMARYNLTVSKNALGDLMTKEDFGLIFGAGTITYAFSFLINGPLVDKIGGKRGIIISAVGAAAANIAMGVVTYLLLNGRLAGNVSLIYAIMYSINMYFQSYGAVSIVKVNSHWFHVKERGVFAGIFGSLIALGLFFAFDWGQAIVRATSKIAPADLGAIEGAIRSIVMPAGAAVDYTWFVFFIPALLLLAFAVLELFLLKDSPSQVGFADFDTEDASSGEMDKQFGVLQIFKKILTNPIILTIAGIEFCSGVVRNGIMHWYFIFAKEIGEPGATVFFKANWGKLLCIAGIYGGFLAGTLSDKLFQSRRGPSAAFMYSGMFVSVVVMAIFLWSSPLILGLSVVIISLFVIGVHGILSGTATMDFGGRKGAATAVGLIDGFVYLGTGFQSICLGYITTRNWSWWPIFLIPFTLIGVFLATRIWKAMPQAKRKGA